MYVPFCEHDIIVAERQTNKSECEQIFNSLTII